MCTQPSELPQMHAPSTAKAAQARGAPTCVPGGNTLLVGTGMEVRGMADAVRLLVKAAAARVPRPLLSVVPTALPAEPAPSMVARAAAAAARRCCNCCF